MKGKSLSSSLFIRSRFLFSPDLPGHAEDEVRQREHDLRYIGRNQQHRHPAEDHEFQRRTHDLVYRRSSHSSAEVQYRRGGRRDAAKRRVYSDDRGIVDGIEAEVHDDRQQDRRGQNDDADVVHQHSHQHEEDVIIIMTTMGLVEIE